MIVFVEFRNTVWRKEGPENEYNKNNCRFFYSCLPPRVTLPLQNAVKLLLVFPFQTLPKFLYFHRRSTINSFSFFSPFPFPCHPRRHIIHIMIHVFFPLLGFTVVFFPSSFPQHACDIGERLRVYFKYYTRLCVFFFLLQWTSSCRF